ncbi:hypothetical protein HC231_12480 [Brenneria izadpanahii]|uniref:HEAT repeat domain-containing protein n=1 Tax=Brenneria izadpanahii TaxID=2722756 RepID=A0ABX7UYB1_9GAMM|nr:hypothetical protein [Brenneria izadpanahii]QTF08628.1 hypothetical protein HC231_12480 [Brenneria izadpanahii]
MIKPVDILEMLKGGDRRSIGLADQAAALARSDADVFAQLIHGISHPDPVIAMRCADAVEKASLARADLLAPHKSQMLKLLVTASQPELRWHIAAMVPRLSLTPDESRKAFSSLVGYTADRSSIVKTTAMQALHDLALNHVELRREALMHIRELAVIGTPAMKARGKKLIRSMERVCG